MFVHKSTAIRAPVPITCMPLCRNWEKVENCVWNCKMTPYRVLWNKKKSEVWHGDSSTVITARNESVILFTRVLWGRHPPGTRHNPGTGTPPPPEPGIPLGADTSPGPGTREADIPRSRHPLASGTPPGPGTSDPRTRHLIPPGPASPPPSAVHAGRYGQRPGGMHPTGM